jgi:hypothetical protein
MRISFSPMRRDDALTVSKAGDVLTINGDPVDFSVIPDGASLPAAAVSNEFVVGTIERIDGDLHVTLILPHGPIPSETVAFPSDIIDPPDGPIAVPHDVEPDHGDN